MITGFNDRVSRVSTETPLNIGAVNGMVPAGEATLGTAADLKGILLSQTRISPDAGAIMIGSPPKGAAEDHISNMPCGVMAKGFQSPPIPTNNFCILRQFCQTRRVRMVVFT